MSVSKPYPDWKRRPPSAVLPLQSALTMSEQQGGFFQFPLCLLATREPFEQWLPRAFAYGVVQFINDTDKDFKSMDAKARTRALERARQTLGFSGGDASAFIRDHARVCTVVNMWRHRHGNTFNVRLKTSYYFEARDSEMLSERDFRVMLGLYSVIGPKSFAKAGWPMIQARAAGHLCIGDPKSYLGPIYSRWQIGQATAELLDRKFVASVTYNRGERFWTHRLSSEELAAAVAGKKTRMFQDRQTRAALNAKTSAAIASAKCHLITCWSGAGDVSAAARPPHVPGTSPSTGASTSPSTLQETLSVEALSVETPTAPLGLRPERDD